MPIGRPSTAVKPIVLATLRPAHHRAHAAAVAEVGDDGAAGRGLRIELRQHVGDVLVGQAVEAVAPHAAVGDRRRQRERLRHLGLRRGGRRCRSRRPAAGRDEARRRSRSASGCAAGAAAPAGSAWRARRSPRERPAPPGRSRVPPCTTRWPTATSWLSPRRSRRNSIRWAIAPSWPSGVPLSQVFAPSSSPPALLATNRGAVPMPSIWPLSCSVSCSPATSKTLNLRLEEPALRTRITSAMASPQGLAGLAARLGDEHRDGAGGEPGRSANRPGW